MLFVPKIVRIKEYQNTKNPNITKIQPLVVSAIPLTRVVDLTSLAIVIPNPMEVRAVLHHARFVLSSND